MTRAQKIIKYFAIALAFSLIVSIFSMVISIFYSIFDVTTYKDNNYKEVEVVNKIQELDIDLNNSKLIIKNSDIFKIEASERIKVIEKDNKIKIKESNYIFNNDNSKVYIYLPTNYTFNEVSIDNGAGNILIDSLNTFELDLNIGAGKIDINKLNVIGSCIIDGGTGSVNITDSSLNNLDLDMGIGEIIINGLIEGNSEIDAGIGKLTLNLNNAINNYYLDIEKGLGEIILNNTKYNKNYISNLGNNKIKIDGGIGSIIINTLD